MDISLLRTFFTRSIVVARSRLAHRCLAAQFGPRPRSPKRHLSADSCTGLALPRFLRCLPPGEALGRPNKCLSLDALGLPLAPFGRRNLASTKPDFWAAGVAPCAFLGAFWGPSRPPSVVSGPLGASWGYLRFSRGDPGLPGGFLGPSWASKQSDYSTQCLSAFQLHFGA